LWEALQPGEVPAARIRARRWTRWAAAAAAVVIGAVVGFVLTDRTSSPKPVVVETTPVAVTTIPAATTAPAIGAKPSLLPVQAVFDPNRRATFYTVSVEQGGEEVTAYRWSLEPPPGNQTCNTFAPVPGKPNQAVWHHADTDGCTHNGIQHDGTVHVDVVSAHWSCTESFFGTLTRSGAKNERCLRR
ncbi:MAG: hypothetical protein ACRDL2_09880, partial [Gaiellaceae bacterium]